MGVGLGKPVIEYIFIYIMFLSIHINVYILSKLLFHFKNNEIVDVEIRNFVCIELDDFYG